MSTIERAALRELARGFACRELTPRAAALDAGDGEVIATCWHQLAEVGLDRALLPEEHGGAGLDVAEFLALVEEFAAGDGGVALSVVLSNAALGTLTPDALAAIPAGARWVLVPAAPGAVTASSGGELSGRVACALGAHQADGLVLIGDRATAVPADSSGVSLERDDTQMGLRGAPMAEIVLDRVAATPAQHAGVEPLALVRAGTAAIARGIARRGYEMALDYARERRQGGVAIIAHDAVRDMLAAMAVRVTLPLPTGIGTRETLAAKIALADAAVATTVDAVQVFGGTGYMCETGIEKLMRDAMYCRLFPEPNWIAKDHLMRDARRGTATDR